MRDDDERQADGLRDGERDPDGRGPETVSGGSLLSMLVQGKEYDLVAAGHICLDIIPEIPDTGARTMGDIFRPGSLVNIGPCAISTGGPVSNTGIGAVKLGVKVAFMAKVGDDEHGQIIRRLLERSGSSEGIRTAPRVSTSYTVAIAPPGIDRMFLHCPGANDTFTADDVNFDLVARAGHFHLGYPPLMRSLYENEGRALAEIFRQAKAAGATTSLDMSLPDPTTPSGKAPWSRILANVLPHVDVFLPSMEEGFFMLYPEEFLTRKRQHGGGELLDHIRTAECSRMAGQFLDMGVCMTSLKSGHRGYYFRTADAATFARMGAAKPGEPKSWSNRELWCPAFRPARIASATGSGDSSIAGFLAAFLRGMSLEDCLRTANCAGYQNLHALDAVSGIRSWAETMEMLANDDLTIIDPRVESEGWREHPSRNMWIGPNDKAA